MLNSDQLDSYNTNGFAMVKGLLTPEETATFRETAQVDMNRDMAAGAIAEKGDSEGNTTLLKMWNEAGDDFYGYIARDQRLVDIAHQIIEADTYIYSHKMTMKEPQKGGAWEWHQDYGYWYQNKCLAPQMFSIWIALDKSEKANGCLQVLTGSHKLGRLDHIRVNGQTIVDKEYLEAAVDRFDALYVEMEPGDALVFDCNLLHRSDANTSDSPRWGYIASYNAVENAPFRDVREYGKYQKLIPVPAGTFMESASTD